MTFLAVVEGDALGWRIDRNALTDAIRARWSGVEIDSMHCSEVRSLIWQFKTEKGPGAAYLHEDGTCLHLWTLTWCSAMRVTPSTFVCGRERPRPN